MLIEKWNLHDYFKNKIKKDHVTRTDYKWEYSEKRHKEILEKVKESSCNEDTKRWFFEPDNKEIK